MDLDPRLGQMQPLVLLVRLEKKNRVPISTIEFEGDLRTTRLRIVRSAMPSPLSLERLLIRSGLILASFNKGGGEF